MNEAETRIAQTILPRDWTSLRDVVLRVGAFFGRDLDLVMINRYLHEGLLDLVLVRPDGTMTRFSKEDCEHRTVHAPFNRAEGVRVEPFEAGRYLARLAELTSPATAIPPTDRPMAPAEESMPEPAPPSTLAVSKPAQSSLEVPASVSPPPQEPTPIALLVKTTLAELASSPPSAPVASTEEPRKERSDEIAAPMVSQESSESEWDPQLEWSVERVMQELGLGKRGWRQRGIIGAVENLPKSKLPKLKRYRGKTIPEILDGITAADLNRAVMEEGKPSSEDSCGRFLKAWKARRIGLRSAIG